MTTRTRNDLPTIRVKREVYEQMREDAAARGMSMPAFIEYLYGFYHLKDIDDLISRYKKIVQLGLDLRQIAQTDVLASYLSTVIRRLGLRR